MRDKAFIHLSTIIEEIELTDKLLSNLNGLEESVDETLLAEMQRKKRNLIKKMLTKMIELGLGFRQFESLYQKIFDFLKSGEKDIDIPIEFKKNVIKAERLLMTE
jgi:hypothetical protein